MGGCEWLALVITAVGVIFGLPPFVNWIKDMLPPKVVATMRGETKLDIRVTNRCTKPLVLNGGWVEGAEQWPMCFQATNVTTTLLPGQPHHYEVSFKSPPDLAKMQVRISTYGWSGSFRVKK